MMRATGCLRSKVYKESRGRSCSKIRWISSSSSSSPTAENVESTQKNRRVVLTVYRLLLRWTSRSPYTDIPLSPFVPPVQLEAPEHVDAARLQALAQIIQTGPSDIVERVSSMLPCQTEITDTRIRVPIHRIYDLEQLVRAIFRINSEPSNKEEYDKKRLSVAFTAVRSLNEMTYDLQDIQKSRHDHRNRENVKFHIGQVVRHGEDRWRGVIADWNRKENDNNAISVAPGKTSLTTKSYVTSPTLLEFPSSPGDNDNNKDGNNNNEIIEYDVILHEGDAHNLGSVLGITQVSQSELELVDNNDYLLRIRSPIMEEYFTRFNATTRSFEPNEFQAYKYPCDDTVVDALKQKDRKKDDDDDDDDDGILSPDDQQICEDIVSAVQEFVSKRLLKASLQENIARSAIAENPILNTVHKRLIALTNGNVTEESSSSSSTATSTSATTRAALHLRELLHLQLQIYDINTQRTQCQENEGRIQFCLGEVVKHKIYGFRGVVVGWDVTPTVDVRNWDGLQHIENPMEIPFYHIVPDTNDCIQAFGGPRPLRYVCQDNLEACLENEKLIQADEKMLDPKEWRKDSSASLTSYTAPFEVKYKYGEDLQDDGVTQDCLKRIEDEFNRWHVLAQRGTTDAEEDNDKSGCVGDIQSDDEDKDMLDKISMQKIQLLLQLVDNQNDAVAVQDTLKEIRKAHGDPHARRELERGVAQLTSGQGIKARDTYRRLVRDYPTYAEGYNKLATVEFLMGQYEDALEATLKSLSLDKNNVPALTGLGLVYLELKQYEDAAYHFEKAMSFDPFSPVSFKLAATLDLIHGTTEAIPRGSPSTGSRSVF